MGFKTGTVFEQPPGHALCVPKGCVIFGPLFQTHVLNPGSGSSHDRVVHTMHYSVHIAFPRCGSTDYKAISRVFSAKLCSLRALVYTNGKTHIHVVVPFAGVWQQNALPFLLQLSLSHCPCSCCTGWAVEPRIADLAKTTPERSMTWASSI